jgi:hypothetical protein
MMAADALRAAPALAGNGPLDDQLGRRIDRQNTPLRGSVQESALDAWQFDCRCLRESEAEALMKLGVPAPALSSLRGALIVPLDGQRFEFNANIRDPAHTARALIIPAHDALGELHDLVALDPQTGATATWTGRAWALGEGAIYAPCLATPGPRVHAGAMDWLRACGRGIFILDHTRARARLAGITLCVGSNDLKFAKRIDNALRTSPKILVEGGA